MTPVFCCGFECGVLGSHWSAATGFSIDTTIKRTGARSLKATNVTSGVFTSIATTTTPTIVVARVYVYFDVLPDVPIHLIQLPTDASGFCSAYFNSSDNKIYARCGTQNGASGITVTTGQWYRIDIKGDVSGSSKLCDVKVDGNDCGQASSAVSATLLGNHRINNPTANSTATIYYDDVVISETSADYPIGAGYVNHFIPTSDGTHNVAGANDFERSATGTDITNATTTAYQLIDDVPLKSGTATEYINLIAPPNATDYVEVVFGPASGISTPTTAPRAVDAIVAVSAASTTGNNLRIALNDNGTTDDIRNATVGSTTVIYSRKHYSDPPSAASSWTLSGNGDFNNVRMRCYTSDANPDPWWASAMIEAEFPEGTTITTSTGIITIVGIAPTFSATQNQTVFPATGTVVISGVAPTAVISDNKNIVTSAGDVTIAGLAPTVQIIVNVAPSVGTVVIEGIAPTVVISDNKNVTPSAGDVTITGVSPTVAISDNKNILTDVGVVVLSGVAPSVNVSDNKNIIADLGVVTIEGIAPTVNISDNKNILTDVGVVTIQGIAPTINVGVSVSPSTGEVVISGIVPTIAISDNKNIVTQAGEIVISGFAPSVGGAINIQPGLGTVTIAGLAPTINISDNKDILTSVGSVIISGLAPEVGGDANINTSTGDVLISGLVPTINISDNISILTSVGEIVIAGLEPTIFLGGFDALVETKTGLVVISGIRPNVLGGRKRFLHMKSKMTNEGDLFSTFRDESHKSEIGEANIKSKIDDGI